jgi:hypothetical protein
MPNLTTPFQSTGSVERDTSCFSPGLSPSLTAIVLVSDRRKPSGLRPIERKAATSDNWVGLAPRQSDPLQYEPLLDALCTKRI